MPRTVLASLLLLLAGNAGGVEICRFRALDAENPFLRWLGSQEVTCEAAGARLDFPEGSWNVFARGAGTVSAAPLLIDGDAEPGSIEPPLAAGATVVPLLPDGHAGVIYVPRRATAFPVDGARVTVPADEPLWLFVLEKTAPVAVISIAPLPPGSERGVDARSGAAPAIVGWLRVPEPDRRAIPEATGLTSPEVRAGSVAAEPLPAPSRLHGAFFRIAGVSPGSAAEVRLEGSGWLPGRRVVSVRPGLTVAAAPLLVRATGTLTVHWNTDLDLPALERSVRSCEEEEVPQVVIAVFQCPAPRSGRPPDSDDCTPIRQETGGAFFGSLTFHDLAPGFYRAEMRYGKLPPASNASTVGPLRVTDLRIFGTWFTTYGSVTRGGEPLGEAVRIGFAGGVGYAPADSEEYAAVFRPPGIGEEAQIEVQACDGSPRAVVLTDRPIRPRARFNIDIPANELEIRVSDTFTHEALGGATVKLAAMAVLRPPHVVFSTTRNAGGQGTLRMAAVPVRAIHLTVSHAGYETRKIEPFTMPKSGTHSVDAQLVPLRGTRGRIVSSRPFADAAVVWFSPAGAESERAELAADGTFVYANRHLPEETMAVVSASHPLWVLRSPETDGRQGSITLRFPEAPAVAFDVWLSGAVPRAEARYLGVAIGGVRVPQPVLAQHQSLRRNPPLLRGTGPQHFADLLATGAIDVLLGPREEDVPGRARRLDLFALPQFADVPRQRLEAGGTDVVFAVK